MDKVALVACSEYTREAADAAVKETFDLLGGIERFVQPNTTVVIKANLLDRIKPEKAATTHPEIVAAVARCVIAQGAKCIIADSPGGLFTRAYVGGVYAKTEMTRAAKESGAELNDLFTATEVSFPEALVGKKMEIIDVLLQADTIINLAKLKSHSFTGYTGCVKNLFGAIPGLQKVQMHGNNPKIDNFVDFVIDIEQFLKPKLCFHMIDAVVGMEGPGPTAGTPRFIGRLIASPCPYSADLAALTIMNAKPMGMPMFRRAVERGIASSDASQLAVVGESLEKSVIPNFKNVEVTPDRPFSKIVPKCLQPLIKRLVSRRPYIPTKLCKGCKKCFEHCPPKAISMVDGKAKIDYDKCIRCYCCQELCPFHVVKVKTPILYKITRH